MPKIKIELNCGHQYHARCLLEYQQFLTECPKCRLTKLYPVKVYCYKCFAKCQATDYMELKTQYYCRRCYELKEK